jgi:hypothetical protein
MLRRLAFWLLPFLVFTVPWEYLYRVDDMTICARAVGRGRGRPGAGRAPPDACAARLAARADGVFVGWCLASIVWSIDSS